MPDGQNIKRTAPFRIEDWPYTLLEKQRLFEQAIGESAVELGLDSEGSRRFRNEAICIAYQMRLSPIDAAYALRDRYRPKGLSPKEMNKAFGDLKGAINE